MLLFHFNYKIEALPQKPTDEQMGTHYYNKCNYNEALKHFIQAKKKDPDNLKHHLNVAKTYLQKDEYENALQALDALSKVDPEKQRDLYLDYLWISGNTYRHMHAFNEAQAYFKQIIHAAKTDNYRHI